MISHFLHEASFVFATSILVEKVVSNHFAMLPSARDYIDRQRRLKFDCLYAGEHTAMGGI